MKLTHKESSNDPYIAIVQGKVFFQAEGATVDQVYAKVGQHKYGFTPVKESEEKIIVNNLLHYGGAGDDDNLIVPKERKIKAGVDFSSEWKLAGKKTFFAIIDDAEKPVEIFYQQDRSKYIQIEDQSYLFKGLFAAHRAKGCLNISVYDSKKRKLKTWNEKFDSKYSGGQDQANYKKISVHIPAIQNARFLTFSIEYVEEREPVPGSSPFLFFTDCSLRIHGAGDNHLPEALILGDWNESLKSDTYMSRISPGAFQEPDSKLDIVYQGKTNTVFTPADAIISCDYKNDGFLPVSASEEGEYTLYLDGAYQETVTLGKECVNFPIRSRYLDNQIHNVMVCDAYGMAILYEDYLSFPASLTPYDVLQRETHAPYPSYLAHSARFRYQALQKQVKRAGEGKETDLEQLFHAHTVLESGVDNITEFKPLAFDNPDNPMVSVVIPAHNQIEFTYYCLCALLVAANDVTFEVIVVDDGSTDATGDMEDFVAGIEIVKNETPQRFIESCNRGAAEAKGEYIVLLNNDTEPTVGWLDELVAAFKTYDNVGLVGSKLLNIDGSLQDAGGIIWKSGNPWNYGRDQNPWDPRFCYVREVDYVSGAAMMTSKEIWNLLGGLSGYLKPMYFDDTDFAFKVRDAGYKVLFVPHSFIYHFEGKTAGTDVSKGFKKYQEINRPKYKRRWANVFRNYGEEGTSPDLEKDRFVYGRVAFIDYTTPRPDRDAGSYAAIQEIRLVQSLGFKATFVPQNMAYLGDYTEQLQRMGVEVATAPFFSSVNDFIAKRGREFDAFYITRYNVAQEYIDTIRAKAPKAKILFCNADLHFLRELRSGIAQKDKAKIANSIEIRDAELKVVRECDVTLSYNEVEHSVITSHVLDSAKVVKCPWVVESVDEIPSFASRKGISFLGSYNHHPNVEAMDFFVKEVIPLLEVKLPEAKLHIYGSSMPKNIKELKSDSVEPEGYVEDVADVYNGHRIFIAPLLSGAGIKGKVLAALAYGIPCVLSPAAAEGIGLRDGYDSLIAEKAEDWVDAINRLYKNEELWQLLSRNGRELVAEEYSFSKGKRHMNAAFEAAGIFTGIDP